jgi:hypothetical protein
MATVQPSAFARRLAEVSRAVVAVTGLLEQVAGLLRQVVHIVGWLVLLSGSLSLLLQPHLSLDRLITPGAGALAVLQGLIKPQRRHGHVNPVGLPTEILGTGTGSACLVDVNSVLDPDEPTGPATMPSGTDSGDTTFLTVSGLHEQRR